MVDVTNLSCRYPDGELLKFNDFQCGTGEKLLVLGASGSGKTSLLHLLSGILRPVSGTILINGNNISALSAKQMDAFRGKHIGMIFQQHYFFHGMGVMENLLAAQKLSGSKADRKYLDALMHNLGIFDLQYSRPEALSQGEQQRFSIARALANKPLLVLADEPTSSLDDGNCTKFVDLITTTISNDQTCWVIATHDNRLKEHFEHVYAL